jgi:putative two-component system response regulator
LTQAEAENPDLILLDVMMPGMTGYEVCKIIKNNSETKHIYIMFLTARGVAISNP